MSERIFRHKKRGTEYELLGFGKMQAQNWYDGDRVIWGAPRGQVGADVDMYEVAVYRSVDDYSEIWVRPRAEFEDGRFEEVPSAAQKENAAWDGARGAMLEAHARHQKTT